MRRVKKGYTGRLLAWGALAAAVLCGPAHGKMSVLDSPHNLSASGGRNRASGRPGVSFNEEAQVCVFCHVPHNAIAGTPLWSRDLPPQGAPYQPYNQSSTLNASPKPDKPTGASRLCLSCHDGTLALGKYLRSRVINDTRMPVDQIPTASSAVNATVNANLTTDLRDDHPISFRYTEALAQKSHLVSPSALPGSIQLDVAGNLECTGCHDPHDNQFGNFLVMNNGSDNPSSPHYMTGSPLCVACHQPEGWQGTKHNNTSIPALGHQCLSCHTVHSAPGAVRLLSHANMDDNCLATCHNDSPGSAPSKNMKPLFAPTMHRHPVDLHNPNPLLDHDEKESLPVSASNYHVQCVDCHNPHQVDGTNAPLSDPPKISGRLKGVRADSLGNYATTEYDVCYKCHSGGSASRFSGVTETMPNRVFAEPDQKERFNPLNPSFHPVMTNRRTTGASLHTDLRAGMVRIYCTDCHNSDQSAKALGTGTGANGPHGSQYPHILMARYDMPLASGVDTREPYSSSLYSLCYRCHSEDYIMNSGTAFKEQGMNEHAAHVRDRRIPCFACHDPHGVPNRNPQVTSTNAAHLINFDKDYAGTPQLTPRYETLGSGSGSCTVACHTVGGTTHSYGAVGGANLLRLQRAIAPKRR